METNCINDSRKRYPKGLLSRLVLVGALFGMGNGGLSAEEGSTRAKRPNVVLIVVDDLQPLLGCYGAPTVKTPNIDRLAARGVMFERAYCQHAVCGPSRASMLTGRRPDTTRIYDNNTEFRAYLPDVVTLPEQFRLHGYHTLGIGKIFHSQWDRAYVGRRMDDPRSWSEPAWFPSTAQFYFTESGERVAREVYARTTNCGLFTGGQCLHSVRARNVAPLEGITLEDPKYDDWKRHFVMGLLAEAPDVPDSTLYDGQVADRAVAALQGLSDQPFFMAVGFTRPHIPYVAPKRYWDMYNPAQFKLPDNASAPRGATRWTLGTGSETRSYFDAPADPLSEGDAARLIHGYHACVSFVDSQVGRIIGELERLGILERTIVVLWGDHGYHLGENGHWGKSTCLEMSTRTPLIVSAPGYRGNGQVSSALVEAVDIYPTLCDLADVASGPGLEGSSVVPLLEVPSRNWKTAVFSQYPRPERPSWPEAPPGENDMMGYAIRTDRYRYVEWHSLAHPGEILGRELYDHETDPGETISVADESTQQSVVRQLHDMMKAGWKEARGAAGTNPVSGPWRRQ